MNKAFSEIKHKKSKSVGKSETKKRESRNDMFTRLFTERLGSYKEHLLNTITQDLPK